MLKTIAAAISFAAALSASPVSAQSDYPSKPVRIISASGAGGISDIFMRPVADALQKRWGQPVVIENRPGGNFNIGARACAEAPADGYTICLISNEALTYNIHTYKNLPFDLENGIVPLTNLFFITQALGVNADLGANSVSDLVAVAKARPKTLSYSSPAVPLVLFMENLNRQHSIDLVKVPFKGGSDAINGVLTGITPITFVGIGNMVAHLRSGHMKALLIDGEKRSVLFPDIPTVTEYGYKEPLTRSYFALYAPAGVSKAHLEKIAADVRAIAGDPAFQERNAVQRGIEPVLNTPGEFAAYLKRDRVTAKRIVDAAGIAAQ